MGLAELEPTETGQRADHATRFKPGQSGNPGGTPVNERNKLNKEFVSRVAKHFHEKGVAYLDKLADEKPDKYFDVILALLPKEATLNVNATTSVAGVERLSRTLEFIAECLARRRSDRGDALLLPDGSVLPAAIRSEED